MPAGSPAGLPDEEILARLVALNAARAAEEAAGVIRWLRPEYQAPGDHGDLRGLADLEGLAIHEDLRGFENLEGLAQLAALTLRPWPDGMAEQAAAVRAALASHAGRPVTAAEIAAAFTVAAATRVAEWLATLVALGQARVTDEGRFVTV